MVVDAKKIITAMLKENTGEHFLDSGGEGGRAWQLNQKRNFEKESPSVLTIDLKNGDIEISKRTFYYLTEFWESTAESERLQKELMKFAELPENEDLGWMGVMEEFFASYLKPEIEDSGIEAYNVDADGRVVNTYNYESSLDQILQYMLFPWKGGDQKRHTGIPFIILQIHGGADARGGYTAPHIFAFKDKVHDIDDFYICDSDYSVQIGNKSWDTDDFGRDWYSEDGGKATAQELCDRIDFFLGEASSSNIQFEGDLQGATIKV